MRNEIEAYKDKLEKLEQENEKSKNEKNLVGLNSNQGNRMVNNNMG